MTSLIVTVMVLAGISIFGVMTSTLLTLRLRKLTQRLELQAVAADGADADIPDADTPDEMPGDFSPSLRQADLQLRLQQGWQQREPPEKYRFINSLAEYGVPAAEIARILGLAVSEVEQLMSLGRVARRPKAPPLKVPRPKRVRASSKV